MNAVFVRMILAFAVLIFISSLCFGCSAGTSAKATRQLELAVKYLSEGKFEEAVLAYNEVLKIDPKNLNAYKGLGKVYALQGKYDEAEKLYLKGLDVVEDMPQLKLCLAGLYVDENKTDKAQEIYNELINSDPKYLPAYEGLMALYLSQGKTDEAIGLLSRCIETNKDNERSYSLLAEAYLEAGNKEEALKAVVKSLEINLNQQAAYDLIERIFQKNWEDVIAYGTEVSKENERVGRMLRIYGSWFSGRYNETINLFEQIPSPGVQDYKAMVYTALAYLKTGRESEADRLIKKIDLKEAKNPVLYADVARYYLQKGDKNKARKIALQGIEIDDSCKENYLVLMEIEKNNAAMVAYYGFMLVTRVPDPPVKALNYAVDHGLKFNNERLSKAYAGIVATSLINSYLQIAKDVANDRTPYYTDEQIHTLLNRRYEAIMRPPVLDKWKEWVVRGHWNSGYYAELYFDQKDEEIADIFVNVSGKDEISGYAIVENNNFSISGIDYNSPYEVKKQYKVSNVGEEDFEYLCDYYQPDDGDLTFGGVATYRYDFVLKRENQKWYFKNLDRNIVEFKIKNIVIPGPQKIDIDRALAELKKKPGPPLTEKRVRELFLNKMNDDGQNYNLTDIKLVQGSFTKTGALEAVVSFYDHNQCHASGWTEVWLLKYENGWRLMRKLADSDSVVFKLVDLESDGRSEILITTSAGGQGYQGIEGELISVSENSVSTLYSFRGFDNTGALVEGEAQCLHNIEFKDVDNDGILELMDTEERKTFSSEGGNYSQKSSVTRKTTFKLINGKFKQIK